MTYSGEGQIDRLEQRPQTARKTASAPERALVTRDGLSGTTLDGKGATSREMRRSRAEQSSGAEGRSSKRQAPSNTSEGVASGSECIDASCMSPPRHTAAQSPGESNLSLPVMVNIHTPKLNAFSRWGGHFNLWPVLNFAACAALWAGIIFLAPLGVRWIAGVTS